MTPALGGGELFAATVERLLGAHCGVDAVHAARGGWSPALWRAVEASGLARAAVDGTLDDAAVVARLCGHHAAPVPLAETALVAAPALALCGLDVPDGALSVDVGGGEPLLLRDGRVDGVLQCVPYGRFASAVVAPAVDAGGDAHVVAVAPSQCAVTPGESAAAEPRDTLRCTGVSPLSHGAAPAGLDASWFGRRVTLSRALLIAGGIERAVSMAIEYVQQREQFGRPLARFQVIQHMLAQAVEEVCVARAIAEAAVSGVQSDDAAVQTWSVAAAKVRAGMAASRCVAVAHQAHGAIGVTFEHPLHLVTTRLLAWRDEGGTETEWSIALGRLALAAGAEESWSTVTRIG